MKQNRLLIGIFSILVAAVLFTMAGRERYSINDERHTRIALILPAADSSLKNESISIKWLFIPLLYGVYCIALGEIESFKKLRANQAGDDNSE